MSYYTEPHSHIKDKAELAEIMLLKKKRIMLQESIHLM